jgi:DNA adenine methylase
MCSNIPHPIPYQGSKRNLAATICNLFPQNIETLYEPFAGSAAVSLYTAHQGLAKRFVIGDSLPQLMQLWHKIIEQPESAADRYEEVWKGQLAGNPDYFLIVRERFNREHDPIDLLYLIARCVKNAVRFNKVGNVNQSADKRRLGVQPFRMRESIMGASRLLKGRTEIIFGDFTQTIAAASTRDLVYMDPPYQGTTYGRDKRYFMQLERAHLIEALDKMNGRRIPFLVSYDGMSGNTIYGEALPKQLKMQRLLINAGRSSQATLNGRDDITIESLYISQYVPAAKKITPTEKEDLFAAA